MIHFLLSSSERREMTNLRVGGRQQHKMIIGGWNDYRRRRGPVVRALGLHAVAPGSNPVLTSGARFSKVPKLSGPFSGVTIPFVSQERNGFKSSNFSYFSFCYLENTLKDRLSKTSGWQFRKWLFGPEKFSGLSRNGPLVWFCFRLSRIQLYHAL